MLAGLVRFTTRAGIAIEARASAPSFSLPHFWWSWHLGRGWTCPISCSPRRHRRGAWGVLRRCGRPIAGPPLLLVLALAGAALAVYHAFSLRMWPIFAAIGLYVVGTAGGGIYASVVQRLAVSPNEQARETPYMLHNIAATRRAFAIDQVEKRAVSGDATLSREDIVRNAETLTNVRLWDLTAPRHVRPAAEIARTTILLRRQRPVRDRRATVKSCVAGS